MKNWVRLVIALLLPQVAGITAALVTETGESSWYRTLQKPDWNPPNWLFAPVWTTLYIMMGVAFYLIWKSSAPSAQKRPAMRFWITQLVFNFFWTIVFFGLHQPGWALAEICCLWMLILITIFLFARISRLAAWLLVPYISWVSFAALLNYAIWELNR